MKKEAPIEQPRPQPDRQRRQIPVDRKLAIDLGGKPLSEFDLARVGTGKPEIVRLDKYKQIAYPPRAYEDLHDYEFAGDLREFRMSDEKVAAITAALGRYFDMELYPLPDADGHLNIVTMNAPTKKEATEVVKFGSAITSKKDALRYQYMHDLYATLYDNIPPLEAFYLEPEETGLEEPIGGIKVKKVEEHPEYQQALAAARNGDGGAHLRAITKYPLEETMLKECHTFNVPIEFDLAPRNIIVDVDGFPQIIDDITTACEEVVKFEYNFYNMISARAGKIVQDHIKLLKAEAPPEQLQASEEKWEAAQRAKRRAWQIIRLIETVPNEDPKKNQRPNTGNFRKAA